jgi:hypothetical protein
MYLFLLGLLIGLQRAGHQSAHGTGRSSGRFDEWHMPDCVGGGVQFVNPCPCGSGKNTNCEAGSKQFDAR